MTDSRTGGIPSQPFPAHKTPNAAPLPGAEPVPGWMQASTGFGDNGHRGDFGEQFIRMLAAAANIDAARRERDRVGVDWQLGHPGRPGTRRYPIIEAQVKCTSSPDVHSGHISYDLKVKNYNQLAGREYDVPRFLFLVLAPTDPVTWSHASPDRLLLRNAAYWACLHDQELCENGTTRTVHVPRANLLTVDSLHGLFTEGRELLEAS
ncbi:DUF4365 domain-containing protein [Streptomyces sp. AK04-3B]|uniref:DUF4365 domain-containing protein n=1 Tax=Streptomyces sp. AK04-3B TaxID=3028650 RepID=UPI0029B288E8|nr:DUF4365 domain-containing protein [Streptomyces sp. AK04-3B]MDX3797179.1 DUF4365 domain-containing protein [Streptomyces sp. AK04-3B]